MNLLAAMIVFTWTQKSDEEENNLSYLHCCRWLVSCHQCSGKGEESGRKFTAHIQWYTGRETVSDAPAQSTRRKKQVEQGKEKIAQRWHNS